MAKESSFIDDLSDIPTLNTYAPTKARGGDEGEGDADFDNEPAATKPSETYPCEHCRGTGRYQGVRLHQPAVECFACKGRGWFKKSYKDRMAARGKARAAKAAKLVRAHDEFAAANPGVIEALKGFATWSTFAAELLAKFNQYGALTGGQLNAVNSMIAKAKLRDATKATEAAARVASAPAVNVDKIAEAFAAATAKGLKRPKLRYEGFTVSLAPATGKNAGALYVKGDNGDYFGKIAGGKYLATREAEAAKVVDVIAAAMADPFALAKAYGARTGNCSCCGRTLTDPKSVEMGIGPVCAERFGW